MSASPHRREGQSIIAAGTTRRDLLAATALGLVAGAAGLAPGIARAAPKGELT